MTAHRDFLAESTVHAEARLARLNAQVAAALASQAEATAQALREAKEVCRHDALTGLSNCTALLDRFAQELADARRRGSRLALMFPDFDDFRQLNDRHGHLTGDHALRRTAKRMPSVVCAVDTVCRQGADEFIFLLPGLQQPGDALVERADAAMYEAMHEAMYKVKRHRGGFDLGRPSPRPAQLPRTPDGVVPWPLSRWRCVRNRVWARPAV